MKKIVLLVLVVVLSAMHMACASKQESEYITQSDSKNATMETTGAQMVNPFEDVATLKDAEKLAGFTFTLPNAVPNAYTDMEYRVLTSEKPMIEVIYKNADDGLRFRKGKIENISGVYIEFPTVETVILDDIKVILKGHGGEVQLVEWKKDDFFYSIYGSVSREQSLEMVKSMLMK